ncbi:MAG: YaiI/YqxD family protein [Clostridia bacterium]|nr:YaiI/YqxD family protein [Clostridia bacterium]
MQIWIDADGCPVVDITVRVANEYSVPCTILCDTAHRFEREGATTVTVEKGADSVDFKLVNLVKSGDVAVTQDYGLAAMCLARGACPVSQNGLIYSEKNIDQLLFSRYVHKKVRRAGGRLKGPSKRTAEQDAAFEATLRRMIEERKRKDVGLR